jgi:hypothetical protein
VVVHERLADSNVERKIIVDFPDRAYQCRNSLKFPKLVFPKELSDRSYRPFVGAFDNGVQEKIKMLIAGKSGLEIEMGGSPIPVLGDDNGPARAVRGKNDVDPLDAVGQLPVDVANPLPR